jgi:hypothetical protein
MSIGAIVFNGCCTNVTEYSMAKTKPPKTNITMPTTKAHTMTSQKAISSSVVWKRARRGGCRLFNFLLQDRCYKILRTVLGKQAIGFLAALSAEVFRILTEIPVTIFTARYQYHQQGEVQQFFHSYLSSITHQSPGVVSEALWPRILFRPSSTWFRCRPKTM